eukprot:scaffold48758_cov61-Phaeocystis_antarctica.AAC.6
MAVPRQAHGCTSGPSHSPSKHSRHLLLSSSSRARLRWARVRGAMRSPQTRNSAHQDGAFST